MTKHSTNGTADVGMIGLGVMGRNLALNMADHGFRVAAFDVSAQTTRQFVQAHPGTPGGLVGCVTLAKLAVYLPINRRDGIEGPGHEKS